LLQAVGNNGDRTSLQFGLFSDLRPGDGLLFPNQIENQLLINLFDGVFSRAFGIVQIDLSHPDSLFIH
jgi:hypothetical protein